MSMSKPILSVAITATVLMLSACKSFPEAVSPQVTDGSRAQAEQFIRLGDSTRDAGDLESAATLYRRAIDLQPEWPEPLLRLGNVALDLNVLGDAELAFRNAVSLDSRSLSARLGLGRALLRLGDYAESLDVYMAASSIDATDGRGYNGAAVALTLLGRHDEAQQQYIQGIAADPERTSLYNNRGLSMAITGDYDGAVAWLGTVLQGGKGNIQTRQTLALVYGLAGDEENASKTGLIDLSAADVSNNLLYYARLRQMSETERASAVFSLSWPSGQ